MFYALLWLILDIRLVKLFEEYGILFNFDCFIRISDIKELQGWMQPIMKLLLWGNVSSETLRIEWLHLMNSRLLIYYLALVFLIKGKKSLAIFCSDSGLQQALQMIAIIS